MIFGLPPLPPAPLLLLPREHQSDGLLVQRLIIGVSEAPLPQLTLQTRRIKLVSGAVSVQL